MISFLVSLTGVAPQRVDTGVYNDRFATVQAFGYKSFSSSGTPINNSSAIYFGMNSGQLNYQASSGASATVTMPYRGKNNLANFWVFGASGDGAFFIAF